MQQEVDLIEAVVGAMNREIARTSADPRTRFEEIKKAVEQNVDMKVWREKFTSDDPDDGDFFEGFAWTGLLEAAHAEMWPR